VRQREILQVAVAQDTIWVGPYAGFGHGWCEVTEPSVKTSQCRRNPTGKGQTLNRTAFRETGVQSLSQPASSEEFDYYPMIRHQKVFFIAAKQP
jgi:hypothetical protein